MSYSCDFKFLCCSQCWGEGAGPEPKPTVLFSFLLDAWKVGLCGSKCGHVCPGLVRGSHCKSQGASWVPPATLFLSWKPEGSWPALGTCSSQSTEYERLGVRWSCVGRQELAQLFPGGRPWIPSHPLPCSQKTHQ